MCHKIIESLKCAWCNKYAVVYEACTDSAEKPHDRDEYLVVGSIDDDASEIIYVKSDNASEITFICGCCVVYIGLGCLINNDISIPCDTDTILECIERPIYVRDYMMRTIVDMKPDENASMCGHRNNNGGITITLCTYETFTDQDTVVGHSTPCERRH